jgi:acyl-CoA-binding protein
LYAPSWHAVDDFTQESADTQAKNDQRQAKKNPGQEIARLSTCRELPFPQGRAVTPVASLAILWATVLHGFIVSRKEPDMSDLKTRFEEAVNYIQNAEGDFQPSNDMKLEFYALYKQATVGDVGGKRPGMMDFVNRAKYDAWAEVKGTSSEDAMQQYIDKLNKVK